MTPRLAALVLVALAWACSPKEAKKPGAPELVVIRNESMVLRQGLVGVKERQESAYVFVNVENHAGNDQTVAIEGVLVDDAGTPIGALIPDELRIPSRETRTFALVYPRAAPRAKSAELHVRRAEVVSYPPPVTVSEVKTETLGDKVISTARIENTLHSESVATVIATFYDEKGAIVGRPFTILSVEPKSSRYFRFQGPSGSHSSNVFVGETVF